MTELDSYNPAASATLQPAAGDPSAGCVTQTGGIAAPANLLRHEGRLLPSVSLNRRGRLGAACRNRFDGRSLREAAEYVFDCDTGPGSEPDAFESLLVSHTGTIGAKQALLAALAEEMGRSDVELIVACCEVPVMPMSSQPMTTAPRTLPTAACWLRYRGRRIQIVEPGQGSFAGLTPVTEVAVRPDRLPAERVRLYQAFAADWCRALETHPAEFARLRGRQLRLSVGTSMFEDLLGYGLPFDYAPKL